MLYKRPVNKKLYERLKKLVSDIIYDAEQDFNKQAQKLADELWELGWGQMQLLMVALNIIFTKFKEIKKEK